MPRILVSWITHHEPLNDLPIVDTRLQRIFMRLNHFVILALALFSPCVAMADTTQTATNALTAEGRAVPRPMTTDDGLDMVRLEDALMSPDGSWVLYEELTLDWDKNKRQKKHFMVSAEGGERWQYLSEEGGSAFQFSPDGKYLTFLRQTKDKEDNGESNKAGNENRTQIFWMRTAGGEAIALTEHDTSVRAYKWSGDGTLLFSALDKRPKDEDKQLKAGADVVFVNEGPNGQDASYWSNLWSFDIATKESTQLTEEKFILDDFDPSPDGQRVALTARYRNRRNDADRTEVFVLDIETREKTRLTENEAPESQVQWAPDSRSFAYMAADGESWLNRNDKIWIMDADQGTTRQLSGKFEGSISDLAWTPDSRAILFNGQQGTRSNLFRMEVASGDFEPLTDVDGWIRVRAFSKDRSRFVYSYSDLETPNNLYAGRLAEASIDSQNPSDTTLTHGSKIITVPLTDANPAIKDLQLAETKLIRWKSYDGLEIEGLLHLPIGYEEGKSYPLILNIHGGPAGYFSNRWSSRYHIHAGLGYVSLSPNVRGSSGYTDALREGNTVARGDGIGLGDFQDLMTGVDALIAQGIVDPDRMGLRGWSYGGILGGWTITQTDRFKAASIGAGVYDWTSEYGPGFNNDVRLWHIGGTPWDNPEGYREQSALSHVKNVQTATILFHGESDTVDTEQQSMMMFTALQDIDQVPVRYLKFPRQPHGIQEPRHMRVHEIEEIRWMQQHILGETWTPWERKVEEDDEEEEEEGEQKES